MKKQFFFATVLAVLVLVFSVGAINAVTPSTNDINRTKNWAHVNVVDVGVGEIELEFVSTRSFYSCFEYRTDGDTSQRIAKNGGNNWNTDITDGLYLHVSTSNSTVVKTFIANEYIEIRMVFGAETDERFDWTRFDVLPAPTKSDILMNSGVPGKGLENAPGLDKPFNPNSQADENAGKK